jgi:hypothetical protein
MVLKLERNDNHIQLIALPKMKESDKKRECQYYYLDLACATFPDSRVGLPLRKLWWRLKRCVWDSARG